MSTEAAYEYDKARWRHEVNTAIIYAIALVVGLLVVFGGATRCHSQMQVTDKLRIEAYTECVRVTQSPERCSSYSGRAP